MSEIGNQMEYIEELKYLENIEKERLNKENKILRENAEHNEELVDNVYWKNKRLKEELQKLNAKLKSQHVQIEVLEDIMKYEWDLNDKIERVINETLNLLKDYENDNEANRYAPIKEAIELLEGVFK